MISSQAIFVDNPRTVKTILASVPSQDGAIASNLTLCSQPLYLDLSALNSSMSYKGTTSVFPNLSAKPSEAVSHKTGDFNLRCSKCIGDNGNQQYHGYASRLYMQAAGYGRAPTARYIYYV